MGFRKSQIVFRATGDSNFEYGVVVKPTYSMIEIMASVQPLNANETAQYTKVNSDGEFTANMIKLYTDEPLLPSKRKVIMCSAYQSGVISHYKSIAQEVDFDGSIGPEEVPSDSDTGGTGSESDMG